MIRPKGQPYTREELKHWATHFKGNSDITNGILRLIAEVERLENGNKGTEPVTTLPKPFEPVLAEISYLNDLLRGNYFEVVYNDGDKWCAYLGSETFRDGEQVVRWRYARKSLE